MNCKAAKKVIDADDPDRGIDDFKLRSHLEDCRSCRAEFPEVLFLLREKGRAARPRRRRSAVWTRFAFAVAATIALGMSFLPLPTRNLDRHSEEPRSVTAPTATAPESPISFAATNRPTVLGVEETGTLRLGRHRRPVDSITFGGVIRPAEIGPRHTPLPRKK